MEIFCPTCNRSSKDIRFIGEFCEACTLGKIFKNLKDTAVISQCKRCLRIKTQKGHVPLDDESLIGVIRPQICQKCEMRLKSFDGKVAVVEFAYPVGNEMVEFEGRIKIKTEYQICLDDYRKSSGYFEGIIQLRGDRQKVVNMSEKITRFMEARGAFISKVEETENGGVDLYLSNKELANKFFLYTGIKNTRSYTLFGLKNGKRQFRNTYLVRL